MYFKRQYYGGGAEHDPRRKLWGEFVCDECGKKEDVEIKQPNLFRYDKIIVCPKCGSYGKEDKIKALKEQLNIKQQERDKVLVEIDTLIKELDSLETSKLC